MGLLITLYLIAANVYNSVKAPYRRGFSFVEMFGLGTQIPILFGIVEYGIVLSMMKYGNPDENDQMKGKMATFIKNIDTFSFAISWCFVTSFNLIYWAIALT